MKWYSHKLITGLAVYSVGNNISLAIAAAVGAVIPDAIEPKRTLKGLVPNNLWDIVHRGVSHWFVIYLVLFIICLISVSPGVKFLRFMMLGAIGHIFEDALCGKVPGFFPRQRFGIKLFKVGSEIEYIIDFLVVVLFGWIQLK